MKRRSFLSAFLTTSAAAAALPRSQPERAASVEVAELPLAACAAEVAPIPEYTVAVNAFDATSFLCWAETHPDQIARLLLQGIQNGAASAMDAEIARRAERDRWA